MVAGMSQEEYVEEVLTVVESIPAGRVMSYGAIAEYVRERIGRGSARQVGTVMSRHGGPVPWHRVVAADGRLVPGHEVEATQRHRAEGTPMHGEKVDMTRAAWWPE
jgi:alkylated DNA nucleotide flippase Atl1